MAVGEGGGELVKQLLNDTWDIDYPGVVAVHLTGKPAPYVGPQDVALAIIGAVFKNGYVKNKVMEFVGPGVSALSTDFRNSVDVMTTETTCLSSVWQTDEEVHNQMQRMAGVKKLQPNLHTTPFVLDAVNDRSFKGAGYRRFYSNAEGCGNTAFCPCGDHRRLIGSFGAIGA